MGKFEELYAQKSKTAAVIAGGFKSGWTCCADIGMGAPSLLMGMLGKRLEVERRFSLKIHTILDLHPTAIYGDEINTRVGVSWFSGPWARKAVARGTGDVMPCYYRDMPRLFTQEIPVNAFMATVSPMDRHGYFSMGAVGSNGEALLQKAQHIYLEVNSSMPRVASAPMVHISQVDALCESGFPIPEAPVMETDAVSTAIGEIIAREIPDGSTLQLGIGAIPDAVGMALRNKVDLGIHTEMLTDSMIELIACGAVTNRLKPVHTGRTVATFAYGSRRMYDYIDDNPAVEILPVDYVNNPEVIARHPSFMSINAALEVDLWGQVCAESVGFKHISGTGGQVDYVRGAVLSPGGKSFIAMPSTAKNGQISRIVIRLAPGAVVTTGKNDVDYIVTEYGIAKLRGRTRSERARALIQIAHPQFREALMEEAERLKFL